MPGLLETLGLRKPLDVGLAGKSSRIDAATDAMALGKVRGKQLALKATAATVAKNMNLLADKIEPGLYALKLKQFESLATRIEGRAPIDAALETDALELKMFAAQSEVALKDNKSNRGKLAVARDNYAQGLVKRLDGGGDLAADLTVYFDGLIAGDSSTRLAVGLGALNDLRDSPDVRVKAAVVAVGRKIAEQGQARQKAIGRAERSEDGTSPIPARTPNDVLVHLMAIVRDGLKDHPDSKGLANVEREGKRLFMTHQPGLDAVTDLIERAKAAFERKADEDAAGSCGKLASQLPAEFKDLTPAQLQDNIYGRVFDSKFVAAVIKDPPQELKDDSGRCGAAFAALVGDSKLNEKAAAKVRKSYVVEDERPWSKAVPGFQAIIDAKDDKEALKALKDFFATPPKTGPEVVAMTYLMTKMSISMQQSAGEGGAPPPPWMDAAGKNYNVIQAQSKRDRAGPAGAKVMSEGAGITMLHQPGAIDDDTLIPSERPGTANRFGQRGDKQLDEVERSEAIKVQHENALPFASGVSGSTNILLHLLKHQKDQGMAGVDDKNALLNAMLFLVYDGGHSMHEVMWTANQLDTKLGFGFGLGDPDKPNEFVADYEVLADSFGAGVKASVGQAMGEAFDGTQDYLEKNSVFVD